MDRKYPSLEAKVRVYQSQVLVMPLSQVESFQRMLCYAILCAILLPNTAVVLFVVKRVNETILEFHVLFLLFSIPSKVYERCCKPPPPTMVAAMLLVSSAVNPSLLDSCAIRLGRRPQ